MPRAHEYREAASLMRRLEARVAHDWALVRITSDPDRISGGPTRSVIGRSLDTTDAELARARVELDRLARICDRRAEICAGFTADLLHHRHLVATTGVWSSPPAPPARWVEP